VRALLLTQEFLPELPGGIANYYYHLSRCLDGAMSVLTTGGGAGGDSAAFDAAQSFTIHRRRMPVVPPAFMRESRAPLLRLPRIGYIASAQWLLFYRHARAIAAEEGTEVALLGHLYLAPLGARLRRESGLRFGVSLHGGELHRYMGWRVVRRTMLRALNDADFLVVNSEFTRRQYLDRGVRGDQMFFKVNPGVDTSFFHPDAGDPAEIRRRHGLGERPVLISVARLVEWKGHDTVLRALPAIIDEVPEALYVIVGEGPFRPDLERLAAGLGLGDHVIFAGFVPESELLAYYRAADLLAVPSREVIEDVPIEGFGIVYVEAGACGIPVVGGCGGGTDESIEDGVTGFRVDHNDPAAVASAVVRTLEDRDLAQRMGKAGRERAVRLYDWKIQAEGLRRFLEDVGGEKKP
jgi:phosphatidylinositol alpha-1,6-mannosyltransferase